MPNTGNNNWLRLLPEPGLALPRELFPRAVFLLFCLCAGLAVSSGNVYGAAQGSNWKQRTFSFYAHQISVADVLLDFSANLSVPVSVSPRARQQTVSGRFSHVRGLDFIDVLSRSNSLIWFFDGVTLFVRHADEIAGRELPLDPDMFDTAAFTSVYDGFVVEGDFNHWELIFDGRVMRLSGLPEYLDFVEKIVQFVSGDDEALQDRVGGSVDAAVVRMLEVRHAYSETQLLNMANILAKTMGVRRIDLFDDSALPPEAVVEEHGGSGGGMLAGLFGTGLSSKNVDPVEKFAEGKGDEAGTDAPVEQTPAAPVATGPHFVAVNVQQRSIIVRDLRSRIPQYRQLLQEIDVPDQQIEIAASILDVNSNFNSKLGVDIQNEQAEGLIEYEYTPSVINDIRTFRARLFALEQDGNARFVSEPSVLTLNNRAAQFKTQQTFYVRLTGDRAVDLVPIKYGTILQVTPNIVGDLSGKEEELDSAKIHLDIHIEDGVRGDSAANVDAVPHINNTVIDTEALVQQGVSLLIGGYQINDQTTGDSGIPFLKDIPVLGLLFSTRSKSVTSVNRYFIITTRIIDYETPEGVQEEDDRANEKLAS